MAKDKHTDRLAKLLRLAAPSSGASEHERVNAALKAAELFVELEDKSNTVKREARVKRRAEPEPSPIYEDYSPPKTHEPEVEAWHRSWSGIQSRSCLCLTCGIPLGLGAAVWRRVNAGQVEWVHGNCPRPGATGI